MRRLLLTITALLVGACLARDEAPASFAEPQEEMVDKVGDFGNRAGGAAPAAPKPMRRKRRKGMAKKEMKVDASAMMLAADMPADEPEPEADEDGEAGGEAPATRAWFPETFLFEPLVETDKSGNASVDVTIPDRLTTWRVLALAHSRAGAQAGAVTTMLGTLPVYIDPIVPKTLLAGDVVDVPIQVVNNTDKPIAGKVAVKTEGVALLAAAGDVSVPPGGSVVRYARLEASTPGPVKLSARFGSYDAVERTFEVKPRGRPVPIERGGTLAAPRELSIAVPDDADPRTTKVRLVVFPGAASILMNEVMSAPNRGGPSHDAYALLLSGRAPALGEAFAVALDAEQLRKMRIVATQRAMRHARRPDPAIASMFTEAALAHPDNAVLARLGERLASQLASSQRPDGTFQGGNGWTLQQVLVATADGVRAVRAETKDERGKRRAKGVTIRASGAFERHTRRVDDAYTAAAILASGAVQGTIADVLRERVKKAIETRKDGAKILPVPKGVVRADGTRPSVVDATALAVLALADDETSKALLPDLGAAILASYRPWSGFGDGATNLVALRAVLTVFKDPIPKSVKIRLTKDGTEVLSGALDSKIAHQRLALSANVSNAVGSHDWKVEATPAVAGLGFTLVVESYVPWPVSERTDLALEVDVERDAKVGRTANVEIRVGAPPSTRVKVRHGLPAGVRPDVSTLVREQSQGRLESYEVDAAGVTLTFRVPTGDAPIRYGVVPSFAGKLHAPASSVEIIGRNQTLYEPPAVWTVAR